MKKSILVLMGILFTVWSCDSDSQKAQRFLLKGNIALNEGKYLEAIDFYSESLALDNTYKEAFNNRGVANYKKGRYTEAINDYSQIIIQIDPSFLEAYRNRANAYLADGRYEKALDDLSYLEAQLPDTAFVHFTKGLVFHEMKDFRASIEAFQQAAFLNVDDAEPLVNQANGYFMLKQLDSAKIILEQAENLDSEEANIFNTYGLIAMEEKDFDLAQVYFDQALKLDRENPFFYNNRGFLFLLTNELTKARKDIRRAIIGAPENPWGYRNRAILFYKEGKLSDALRNFELAAGMDNKIPLLHYYWALALQASGELGQACETIKLEIDPDIDIGAWQSDFCS